MSLPKKFQHPYKFDPKYSKKTAYFCMEFAIDQSFKIYSGGLGFLAGSHMRSAYDLKQNMVGIGLLWKYGYYDQIRAKDQSMDVLFQEKIYSFLEDTGIKFSINLNNHPVWVKAYYLDPEQFGTVPMFFLSTDLPENDYLAQTTTHRLYESNTEGKVAQSILLGLGGAKLLDELNWEPEIYHLNEAHALSAAFHLYKKFDSVEEVKKRMVFTTHTPEEAGNEKHNIHLLNKLGFFNGVPLETVRELTGIKDDIFNHSLVALRLSHFANGVSKLHGEVSREMWKGHEGICPITHVTNAQNARYWQDPQLKEALAKDDDASLIERKKKLKKNLFQIVADQTGNWFDPNVFTIVWARRYAEYKRPDLITRDMERFHKLLTNTKYPIQIIWAGKPYPMDYGAVGTFNSLVHMTKQYKNAAVLVGYELQLSRMLKYGSDMWLNNPRVTREASGTSGMTAAMNAGINFSTYDGWICEFTRHGSNGFIIPATDHRKPHHMQDQEDMEAMYYLLEHEVLPTYYDKPEEWTKIVKTSMKDVTPYFDADRMAHEYYEHVYNNPEQEKF
ncbi:alpha-glucan family phosphorylase [Persicobacter sp. CCB-QB2]|uniref:alpha-glucan family phosphorylase n=1 Tax=Persicobacter sp. CCB-QB2 TaxID=1561025 RepID=UPI0006A9C827|nr:alpha-glucan family phosphorylase [Persicobacter sp. CCB-QB2]